MNIRFTIPGEEVVLKGLETKWAVALMATVLPVEDFLFILTAIQLE